MRFFEKMGCALKTERGNRVFPQSDRSASVLQALQNYLRAQNVEIKRCKAKRILIRDGVVAGVSTDQGDFFARHVIVCTGGCSYPLTGSTGDGYVMASELGHAVLEPVGSLVPLVEAGDDCAQMQGLSLRNVAVKLINQKGKTVFEDFGELLFTHFGVSGPTILSASAHMQAKDQYAISIDLKPALDEQKLDQRILRDFDQYPNRTISHTLQELYPRSMIPVMLRRAGIDPETKTNSVTKQQRRALLEHTKKFLVPIQGKRPVAEAIITSGGVAVKNVDPKTMESKLVPGLFFAGEILDVDAYTGGFNLQIAWSTGRAAGLAAAVIKEDVF